MKLEIIIEYLLPPVFRRPRWVALLKALSAPLAMFFDSATATANKARRRAGCDGSVIALAYMLEQEFGIPVSFADERAGTRRYIRQRGESLAGVHLSKWYIYNRGETPSGDFDYYVLAPGTSQETKDRIKSVINIYNSAGFVFAVVD